MASWRQWPLWVSALARTPRASTARIIARRWHNVDRLLLCLKWHVVTSRCEQCNHDRAGTTCSLPSRWLGSCTSRAITMASRTIAKGPNQSPSSRNRVS